MKMCLTSHLFSIVFDHQKKFYSNCSQVSLSNETYLNIADKWEIYMPSIIEIEHSVYHVKQK